ncbi:MAG: hypothetical protein K5799_09820 [Erythrobacter sp.]|nr:hypothetical protein [Erythrobacter sp.]
MSSLALGLVLLLGGCLFIEVKERQSLRASLPPQLEPSYIVNVDMCSRTFGGYSYVVSISPDAVDQLGREGTTWLAQVESYPPDGGKAAPWRSTEGMVWDYDGPPAGLLCLRQWNVGDQQIKDHIYRKGSYVRSYHRRQADYIIPSLGIVVGGFDPR